MLDMGMKLGLGVIVAKVDDGGLAARGGLKNGDQLFQVKLINTCSFMFVIHLILIQLYNLGGFSMVAGVISHKI